MNKSNENTNSNLNQSNISLNEFNPELEKIYHDLIIRHKKEKQQDLLIKAYLGLISYYAYYNDKFDFIYPKVQKCYLETTNQNALSRYNTYLKTYSILSKLPHHKRRSLLFLYLTISACYEEPQLMPAIPILFNELKQYISIYDLNSDKIETIELFDEIHSIIYKNNFKPISFMVSSKKKENGDLLQMKKLVKRRIEPEYNLHVINNRQLLLKYVFESKWESLQYNIFANMLNYYKAVNSKKDEIAILMASLQTLYSYISSREQHNLIQEHLKCSLFLQEKLNINLIKCPMLIRIIPITSDIKFTFSKKYKQQQKSLTDPNNIFIYNPWEKNEKVNYFWTLNSYQKVLIQFYNPLKVSLSLTKISLIFSDKNKPLSYYTNLIIEPKSIGQVHYKIKLIQDNDIDILGVKYEIENTSSIQYVDINGNGLFYSYENVNKDSLSMSTKKKEKINLRNITIYSQIPCIHLKIVNNDLLTNKHSPLTLYEYQKYTFEFLIINNSGSSIKDITIMVYAFKKDDYKIMIDEIVLQENELDKTKTFIQTGKNFRYKYNYIHKKMFKKIEFRFFYTTKEYNNDSLKPFLHYIKTLNTLNLFSFSKLKVCPFLINPTIENIIKNETSIVNKKYSFNFCSDIYYIHFLMNITVHKLLMKFDIENSFNVISTNNYIQRTHSKEISLIVDTKNKLSETVLKWEFETKPIKGEINLFQMLTNELNFKFFSIFAFGIETQVNKEEGFVMIKYSIRNKTAQLFKDLRMKIYLYQLYENQVILNKHLEKEVFYEGCLEHLIKNIDKNEKYECDVKVYPHLNEYVHTTCVLIDKEYKVVYVPSFSKVAVIT